MPGARLGASILVVASVLTACSSGTKSGSAPPATTAAVAQTPAVTRGTDDPFCIALNAYNQKYGQVNTGATDPDQLRAAMQAGAAAITDADRTAPAEIKGDVDVLDRAFQQLLSILEASNFDLTKVSLAQVQQFSTPEFTTAGQNVNAYVRDHC